MHPSVRRDLARLGQLDHVPGGNDLSCTIGRFSFQVGVSRGWRMGIDRQTRSGIAAIAFDLASAEPAVEALAT
jgi:hypothetical protein